MKKLLMVGGWWLAVVLVGCTTYTPSALPTPTPEPLNPAVDFFVEVQRAESTAKAIEATQVWIWGQLTATQQVKEDQATQHAAMATAQAFAMASTATHEAFAAEQYATQRSFDVTSTAQSIGTATAYPQTATAQSIHATQTQQAWETTATMDAAYGAAQATAAMGNAESVQLALERERVTNMTRAWVPWMAFVVALGVIALMGYRWSKTRVVQKDAFGASPVLIMDGKVINPDLMPGPALLTAGAGVDLVAGDPEVTRRAQGVQMMRALPAGKQSEDMLPVMDLSPRTTPRIEVIEPGQLPRTVLDDIQDKLVEED